MAASFGADANHWGRANHPSNKHMREFELYLPMTMNNGTPVDGREIQRIKDELVKVFGVTLISSTDRKERGGWVASAAAHFLLCL
jgi:hypothetical protein